MPVCFQLFEKGKTEPSRLSDVDSAICQFFNVPCDTVKYHASWYDIIGFRLALGKSFAEIRAYLQSESETSKYQAEYLHLVEICDYLSERYTTSAWYQRGKD